MTSIGVAVKPGRSRLRSGMLQPYGVVLLSSRPTNTSLRWTITATTGKAPANKPQKSLSRKPSAQESKGQIALDPFALNPTFDYYDDNDALHHVWFLDAVTVFNQLVEGQRYGPHGFALWRLGSEDPSIWPLVARRAQLDRTAVDTLRQVHYGYGLDYEGRGEVLKVTATPKDGVRELTYDAPSGLVTAAHLSAYPSSYVITRWGGADQHKIALTFDDGPDPLYTPQVLEILRSEQVPATFFIVGLNGDLNA